MAIYSNPKGYGSAYEADLFKRDSEARIQSERESRISKNVNKIGGVWSAYKKAEQSKADAMLAQQLAGGGGPGVMPPGGGMPMGGGGPLARAGAGAMPPGGGGMPMGAGMPPGGPGMRPQMPQGGIPRGPGGGPPMAAQAGPLQAQMQSQGPPPMNASPYRPPSGGMMSRMGQGIQSAVGLSPLQQKMAEAAIQQKFRAPAEWKPRTRAEALQFEKSKGAPQFKDFMKGGQFGQSKPSSEAYKQMMDFQFYQQAEQMLRQSGQPMTQANLEAMVERMRSGAIR